MYKNWLVRGDCHGWFYWLEELDKERYKPLETAFIVLGDFGVNYYLDKKDEKKKQELCKSGYTFYVDGKECRNTDFGLAWGQEYIVLSNVMREAATQYVEDGDTGDFVVDYVRVYQAAQ